MSKTFNKPIRVSPKERRTHAGRTYDSILEMRYAQLLDTLIEQGIVVWRLNQVTIDLGPVKRYKVDFIVCGEDGIYAVDVKGFRTKSTSEQERFWFQYGPFPLHIVEKSGNGFKTAKVIDGA